MELVRALYRGAIDSTRAARAALADEYGSSSVGPRLVRAVTRDGRTLSLSWTGTFDPEESLMLYVGRDVTAETEARAALESLVMDSFAWFKNMVRDRRHLDAAALEKVSDGRVFTGRQGLELKLIDALGAEEAALDWLAKEKGVDRNTPVRDYRLQPRFGDLSFIRTAAVFVLDAAGLSSLAQRIGELGAVQAFDRLNLDGLLALWHPPVSN